MGGSAGRFKALLLLTRCCCVFLLSAHVERKVHVKVAPRTFFCERKARLLFIRAPFFTARASQVLLLLEVIFLHRTSAIMGGFSEGWLCSSAIYPFLSACGFLRFLRVGDRAKALVLKFCFRHSLGWPGTWTRTYVQGTLEQ